MKIRNWEKQLQISNFKTPLRKKFLNLFFFEVWNLLFT